MLVFSNNALYLEVKKISTFKIALEKGVLQEIFFSCNLF